MKYLRQATCEIKGGLFGLTVLKIQKPHQKKHQNCVLMGVVYANGQSTGQSQWSHL